MLFTPPMTMMDFFAKSEGVWFTQRNVHHFDASGDESGESNLYVKMLLQTDPRVQSICEQQGIDPQLAMGGASFMWQPNEEKGEPDPDKAAVLIDIPNDETRRSGKLIRDRGYVEQIPVVSRYWFGQDGILTIDTDYDRHQGQERCWFLTDDFRVRVSNVRMHDGVYLMTYCSERRCVTAVDLQQMISASADRV
jgi:hypothetical protein